MAEQNTQENSSNLRWFVVQTRTGWEQRVKTGIEHYVSLDRELAPKVQRVLVPLKKMVEAKGSKQRDVNIMPGYVFVQMEPDNRIFEIIQKVEGVSVFLGPQGHPAPLSEEEMNRVLDAIRERPDRRPVIVKFRVNDQVRVTEGPFEGFVGTVEHVDEQRGKLKVAIGIFGRGTTVELDASQVEDAVQQ